MDLRTAAIAVTGFFGFGLLVLVPVLLLLAASSGRERRWVARNRVSPCAALRPGVSLPKYFAVYGHTVPGRAGLVVAPLSGAEGVWFRTMVYRADGNGDTTRLSVLWEQSGGDPFGVADDSGVAAVSADILQGRVYSGHLSVWAQTRHAVGSSGPSPAERPVHETTARWRDPGPWLRHVIDRGLIAERSIKGADRVGVVEEFVPSRVPMHLIGKPAPLADGTVGLTLPRTGPYLVCSRPPAETEQALRGDGRSGLGCAFWAAVVGAVCLAACLAIAYSFAA
ncbi:hypothetical protein [Actinoplanes aureus]|uniref:Uncharacterized protein n=1 Tax=Actinoplanes aureus TaxID=2792083 RepID=A0A931C916_9ACTN|nr:hypothetical protein [Actinoplanes aureus]MBG0564394.1 hypothetical protein [Actinoplanes aureus]